MERALREFLRSPRAAGRRRGARDGGAPQQVVVSNGDIEQSVTMSTRLRLSEVSEHPATGDWVLLRSGQISMVLPRRTAFVRQAAGTAVVPQVVAANVNRVFIVTALPDDVNPRRLERYLAVA